MSTQVQEVYLNALVEFREVVREVDDDSGFFERSDEYHASVAAFRVLIPLVGSFNAGKTSLVNAWLQRPEAEGLPTDVVPQTALATEIHFVDSADAERIELYDQGDRLLRRIDLAEFQRVEKQALTTGESEAEYARAMVHTPRDERKWSDWKVLVDMPGLDSGLRTHNAAIQRYLPLGGYFILVMDIEHGALRATEIEQLREFLEQEVEFAVLINKADHKNKAAALNIVEHVDKQVREEFGASVGVFPVSAHARDISAFHRVIEEIDFDRALRSFWRERILRLFDDEIGSLQTRYSALNVSTAERERTLASLSEKKQALEKKLHEDTQEIRSRYSDRAVERIVRAVRAAIRDHAASLAHTWHGSGEQAFQHELNDLVRRTLNRVVDKERQETLKEIIDRYETELDGIAAQRERFLRAGESATNDEVTPIDLVRRLGDAAQQSGRAFNDAKERVSAATTTYTAVTGVLAAATSIVAPWLEVVIIALPVIVKWISKQGEEERRQEQLDQLQSQVSSMVASRVASELRERVTDDFQTAVKETIAAVQQEVRGHIERIETDIEKSRAEMNQETQDVEQRTGQLHDAISRLTEAKRAVTET